MVIFETDRLVVRRYTLADEENFFRVNGDAEVMRYIRDAKSREECSVFLKRNLTFYELHPLMGRWAVTEKATNAFVGSFAIIPVETTDYRRQAEIQLGYALLKAYWGKGYATESTLAGKQYAFDVMKLPRLVAVTDTANIGSQKVLLRGGFQQQPNIIEGQRELCYFAVRNPNCIETERLLLFPLTVRQLALYAQAGDALETALNLTPFGRTMAPEVRSRIAQLIIPAMQQAGSDRYPFHTFWLAVDKYSRLIVAELGFKAEPVDGVVEIGYGTMPAMQNMGYMTEAVKGLLQWTAGRADVRAVVAETHVENKASIRVVEKNGFERVEMKGEMVWWRKDQIIA